MEFKSFMEALKGKQHKIDKNKNGKIDAHDFKLLQKEEQEITEAAVKSDKYSWGKMMTVHHGASHSYPLHPEHQEAIRNLKHGEKTSFKDETGAKVNVHRDVEDVHFTSNKTAVKTTVPHSHFTEESHQSKTTMKHIPNPSPALKKAAKDIKPGIKGYRDRIDMLKAGGVKEEVELDEAMINGREYASHGLMHPDHAAHAVHKVTGQSIDFYAHGSGDKVEGKVTKNDGKAVHIKDTKGTTHKFKVQRGLPKQQNEEKKEDPPFDGPYKKVATAKNSDGTTQSSMSRARELAQMAMKKKLKEDIDRLFEAKDDSEYNFEGEMAVTQLKTICRHAEALEAKMKPDTNLPEWVQAKITLATDYMQTAHDYLMSELEEQAPVAPVPDRKYIKGTPENKAYKATKKPINGIPTGKYKEDIDFNDEGALMTRTVSYKEFLEINEIKMSDLPSRVVRGHSYGANYSDPEGADDYDDKPTKPAAEKRGRGRPAGAQSGARKILGTSKLHTK